MPLSINAAALALVAAVPAFASLHDTHAGGHNLVLRDDPCAKWCDPWFAIADAKVACQFLASNMTTFSSCASCSIQHGGSIDEWAADYYGGVFNGATVDYAYFTDCPSCYDITVGGPHFSDMTLAAAANATAAGLNSGSVASPSASQAYDTAGEKGAALRTMAMPTIGLVGLFALVGAML